MLKRHAILLATALLMACQKQIIEEQPDSGNGTGDQTSVELEYYTVSDILQHTDQLPTGPLWVAGFVVGHTSGSMANAQFTAAAATHSNILLSPHPDDHTHLLPVELTTKAMQQALSLMHNPDSLNHAVRINAYVSTYYRVTGLRSITQYQWLGLAPWLEQEWNDDTANNDTDPDTNEDNNDPSTYIIKAGTIGVNPCGIDIDTRIPRRGNVNSPYLPSDIIQQDGEAILFNNVHCCLYGYAVGYADNDGEMHYNVPSAYTNTLLVSDVKTGCTPQNTIFVELMDNEMQQAMSLATQPQRIGHMVRFEGVLRYNDKYKKNCMQTDGTDYWADWLTQ